MAKAQPSEEIVDEIKKYATEPYSDWYAGIARRARKRLFTAHRVSENGGRWIFRKAHTNANARVAESALHAAGFQGGPGGGKPKTRKVYAYKITSTTVE